MKEQNLFENQTALHDYQFKEILETQEEHNKRIQVLEANKIEMKMEFQNLKQSQMEQKALILELDRVSREKNDRLFDKMFTSQDTILNKVLENTGNVNKGNVEITKGKLVLYGTIVTAIVSIVTIIANKIWG